MFENHKKYIWSEDENLLKPIMYVIWLKISKYYIPLKIVLIVENILQDS